MLYLAASVQDRSIEAVVIDLLREAFVDDTLPTLDEVVARIRALPPNPANFRPASGSLAEFLAERKDSEFDLAAWEAEWAQVEAEMEAIDLAGRR
jgi:cell pole-organizing protein PopZ